MFTKCVRVRVLCAESVVSKIQKIAESPNFLITDFGSIVSLERTISFNKNSGIRMPLYGEHEFLVV